VEWNVIPCLFKVSSVHRRRYSSRKEWALWIRDTSRISEAFARVRRGKVLGRYALDVRNNERSFHVYLGVSELPCTGHSPAQSSRFLTEKWNVKLAAVAHAYNPSDLGGRDQEIHGLRPAWAKSSWDPPSPISTSSWAQGSTNRKLLVHNAKP
jgi:hypothetical protein